MNYEKEIENLNKDATRLLKKYEEKTKEIKRLNNIIYKVIGDLEDVRERLNYYGDDNFKIDMSMLTFWIDLLREYKVGSEK